MKGKKKKGSDFDSTETHNPIRWSSFVGCTTHGIRHCSGSIVSHPGDVYTGIW